MIEPDNLNLWLIDSGNGYWLKWSVSTLKRSAVHEMPTGSVSSA